MGREGKKAPGCLPDTPTSWQLAGGKSLNLYHASKHSSRRAAAFAWVPALPSVPPPRVFHLHPAVLTRPRASLPQQALNKPLQKSLFWVLFLEPRSLWVHPTWN